ncbi:MAG: sporulation peptidase YabG [Clostridia bacterium]|jgi:spore coat assembly protein|nr:sporulation peptidase YabG [Clostridia bacterium]
MKKIKKGDIVGRISYGKDIIFVVERIIKTKNGQEFAILKGLTIRIQADSLLEDLELVESQKIEKHVRDLEEKVTKRIERKQKLLKQNYLFREKVIEYTGKILHLDGDRRYSEKSRRIYKKLGLNAIVKNVPERRQPLNVRALIQRYKPDILVMTGHDGMIRKGTQFNNVYNYRNSRYFIKAVEEARKQNIKKDLVIFAGACQSYYEGLMISGANFASSPARILIDFMDPLIVAEKIATTKEENFVTIQDIEEELRDGQRGISGVGGRGKKKILSI